MIHAASRASRSGSMAITVRVITCSTVRRASRWLTSHTDRLVAGEGMFNRMSRSVTMPSRRPSPTTSRWRMCSFCISARASSTGVVPGTLITIRLMRSLTRMETSFSRRRAVVEALGDEEPLPGTQVIQIAHMIDLVSRLFRVRDKTCNATAKRGVKENGMLRRAPARSRPRGGAWSPRREAELPHVSRYFPRHGLWVRGKSSIMRRMVVRALDLNGTFARASAAVFAVDGQGRMTLWNRAVEKLLGHSAREAIGQPSCAIVRSDADGAPTLCYRGCHAGLVSVDGQMKNVDVRTRTRAGRLIEVNVSALVIAGPKDRGPTVMHLLREATTPRHTAGVNGNGNGLVAPERSDAVALTRREIDVLRLMGAG